MGWAVGEPLLVEEEMVDRKKLDYRRVLVLIPLGQSCPSGINVVTGKDSFSVTVQEDLISIKAEWISKRWGIEDDALSSRTDGLNDKQAKDCSCRHDDLVFSGTKEGIDVINKTLTNNNIADKVNFLREDFQFKDALIIGGGELNEDRGVFNDCFREKQKSADGEYKKTN